MTFVAGYREPVIPMVSALGPWSSISGGSGMYTGAPASAAMEAANTAIYYPLVVPTVCVATRMFWANGGTVNASYNVEAGIYRDGGYKPGAKLVTTGSVAQGTASQVQFADITDTTLSPGLFWLVFACSTTSATFFRATGSSYSDELSRFQESSITIGSLPAAATPVESANANYYVFGFSTTTIT